MRFLYLLLLAFASLLAFPSLAQASYYYSKKGQKQEGTIVFHPSILSAKGSLKPGYILYTESGRQKSIKLTIEDISAFVIGSDSFTLIQDLKLSEDQSKGVEDMVEVVEKGKMNLYVHASRPGSESNPPFIEKYILSLSSRKTLLCIYDFDKQQKDIANLFESNPRLKELILSGKVNAQTIANVVRAFNGANPGAYSSRPAAQTNHP